jgi:hypothetical protein
MQISKLVILIIKIFLLSALASMVAFFVAVYIDCTLLTVVLPVNAHVEPTLYGALMYALYNGIEISLFFTTFVLLIVRLSIVSGTILTVREIIRYYKKYIITTLVVTAALACTLCVIVANTYADLRYVNNVLLNGIILTCTLPVFWFILAAIYYRGYQSKINEPDGCKDRNWLEGNIEK